MQRSFLVEDRVLVFTEAKSHVDNAKVEEMTVQFQAPIIDAMNMRSVLAQQAPQPKRPKDEAEAELMEEEEEAEMVDIDEEVEVLPEGEVVGLVGTSSSSSSSSDYGADALVELPMDVSKPDEVSDGDDVLCDAPTPLRPKGKGKGKVPRRPPGAPPGGRGGLGMRPARAPFTPAVCPNRRALRAAARVTGAIDLDDAAGAIDLG
eukprot:g11142.t1